MTHLIAAVGLSGSGKTTGLQHLACLCNGQYIYLGQTVLEAVRDLGLPTTPEYERTVRLALREQHGRAALVKLNLEKISGFLKTGVPVLLDAIFNLEELDLAREVASPVPIHLVSISAPFEVRCERVKARPDRPFTSSELQARDETELETLGTAGVLRVASYAIVNGSSLREYQERLWKFLQTISSS
jgi:dephospho-CoA kinase